MTRSVPLLIAIFLSLAPLSDPDGNLVMGRSIERSAVRGAASALSDGLFLPEGAAPTDLGSCLLLGDSSWIRFDLGTPQDIGLVVVQCDGTKSVRVELSIDGTTFVPLWITPRSERATGVRTHEARAKGTRPSARFVRVSPAGGPVAVSGLAVFRDPARVFEPGRRPPPPTGPSTPISAGTVSIAKGVLALLGCLVLVISYSRSRRGLAETRPMAAGLIAVSTLAFGSYYNFGAFRFYHYFHYWDFVHYYMGAKYSPELSYTRLYRCLAVADLSFDGASDLDRPIRDLETNVLTTARGLGLDRPAGQVPCLSQFSPRRWGAFLADVGYFRSRIPRERWRLIVTDHGYNPTPVWGILGGLLARTAKASDRQMLWLGLLDPALIAVMWALVAWAFGWRTAAVAILFWGTCVLADFGWVGGSYLRWDWVCALVGGVSLLKRGWPRLAGFAFTYATLCRAFPAVTLAVLGVRAVLMLARHRRRRVSLGAEDRGLLVGALAGILVLVPAAGLTGGNGPVGVAAWEAFAHNSSKHLATPTWNNVGLSTLLAHSSDPVRPVVENPETAWWAPHARALAARQPIRFLLIGAFLVLLGRRLGEEAWRVAILSMGLVPLLISPSGYYFCFLLVYALLWPREPVVVIATVLVSALSGLLAATPASSLAAYEILSAAIVLLAFLSVAIRSEALRSGPASRP